ncbi:uncharacterized protein [Henckelia pumila]|uniref:uncharacterized protein n=1 Tax=Henckelia pumila TaxID=405737 RepID=UPI003C6E8B63
MVQDLYGLGIRPMTRHEFHKPYPEIIDINNPYPKGFKVPNFTLFSGDDSQSSTEHVSRLTIRYGTLGNYENFPFFKMRLFPNTLTGTTFTWYTKLQGTLFSLGMNWRNCSILSSIELSQKLVSLIYPEPEFVKLAQRGLDLELRKKFQGTEFRDFYEMDAKDVEDVFAEVGKSGSCLCTSLKREIGEPAKLSSSVMQGMRTVEYIFDISKTEEIFDFLVKEKFITFPADHHISKKAELKGKEYCKYHNSFNHNTNSCWEFRNIIQDRITKGVLKFPEKNEIMPIDEDPFPHVAQMNASTPY